MQPEVILQLKLEIFLSKVTENITFVPSAFLAPLSLSHMRLCTSSRPFFCWKIISMPHSLVKRLYYSNSDFAKAKLNKEINQEHSRKKGSLLYFIFQHGTRKLNGHIHTLLGATF